MIHRARSVRVVVLLNYSSLKADRGRGVRDLTNILTDLFGRADHLLSNAPSILLGAEGNRGRYRCVGLVTRGWYQERWYMFPAEHGTPVQGVRTLCTP